MLEAILVLGLVISPQPAPVMWRLPATIQTLRDVTVQREDRVPLDQRKQRGFLGGPNEDPIVIKKGKRFLMVEILGEGGCTIEIERRQYSLGSCYWLEGFTDPRKDVFKVVAGRTGG